MISWHSPCNLGGRGEQWWPGAQTNRGESSACNLKPLGLQVETRPQWGFTSCHLSEARGDPSHPHLLLISASSPETRLFGVGRSKARGWWMQSSKAVECSEQHKRGADGGEGWLLDERGGIQLYDWSRWSPEFRPWSCQHPDQPSSTGSKRRCLHTKLAFQSAAAPLPGVQLQGSPLQRASIGPLLPAAPRMSSRWKRRQRGESSSEWCERQKWGWNPWERQQDWPSSSPACAKTGHQPWWQE